MITIQTTPTLIDLAVSQSDAIDEQVTFFIQTEYNYEKINIPLDVIYFNSKLTTFMTREISPKMVFDTPRDFKLIKVYNSTLSQEIVFEGVLKIKETDGNNN